MLSAGLVKSNEACDNEAFDYEEGGGAFSKWQASHFNSSHTILTINRTDRRENTVSYKDSNKKKKKKTIYKQVCTESIS